MKAPLLERIKSEVLVANGAMGTALAARGLRLPNSGIANVEHPQVVMEILREYKDAGATVFQANTFGGNYAILVPSGYHTQHDEINRAGMRIAREAIGDDCYLAANFGPTGLFMEPMGTATPEYISEQFQKQASVLLAEGDPDFLLLETFEDLTELEAAVAGVRAAGCRIPLGITFSFSQESGRSMMGVSPVQAAEKMLELGADIIGANCGLPQVTIAALREMAPVSDRPLMMQANAGIPEIRRGETCFSGTPEDAATLAREAADLGARIIGGCCGTTAEHIRAIAAALR